MAAQLAAGWIATPYSGSERSHVEMSVGHGDTWSPAFLDWESGVRVAKIRAPNLHGHLVVWLSVDGHTTQVGTVTL